MNIIISDINGNNIKVLNLKIEDSIKIKLKENKYTKLLKDKQKRKEKQQRENEYFER